MKKILIVDDHGVTLRGITCLFRDYHPSFKIIVHNNNQAMLRAIKKEKFDLLILGLNLPDIDTLLPISTIQTFQPGLKILVYSVYPEDLFAKRILQMGAKGYLEKKTTEKLLAKAIEVVMGGGIYLSAEMTSKMLNHAALGESSNPFEKLSDREFEILLLIIRGYNVRSISKSIRLHTSTIGTYKSRLFEKLGVNSIVDLIQMTNNYGLK